MKFYNLYKLNVQLWDIVYNPCHTRFETVIELYGKSIRTRTIDVDEYHSFTQTYNENGITSPFSIRSLITSWRNRIITLQKGIYQDN
jgi:ASC-1-like (ASCH) protein